MSKKIGVVGIPGGWSTDKLLDAVEAKTGFRCLIDMAHVRVDLSDNSVWHKDVELTALDGLIVKKIAPSYSPDALERMELLNLVEARGVAVFSKPSSMLKLIDRLAGTVALRAGGMPMPDTTITEDVDEACGAVEKYGRAVFKPLYSSKARGMTVIEPGPQMRDAVMEFKGDGNQMMYIQKMVEHAGRDLGVTFLGGEYLATYARQGSGDSWDTTTRTGGKYVKVDPSQDIIDISKQAIDLFPGMAFTCVDVVETPEGPKMYEVSAFGGFRGLLDACNIDVAERYAQYALENC